MTPLAQRLVRNLIGLGGEPPFSSGGEITSDQLLRSMLAAVCFEISEVAQTLPNLGRSIVETTLADDGHVVLNVDMRYTFLPAPVTWVEYSQQSVRIGYLLMEHANEIIAALFWANAKGKWWGKIVEVVFPHRNAGDRAALDFVMAPHVGTLSKELSQNLQLDIFAILAIINSPKIMKRTVRQPHHGLAREVANTYGPIALRPWHEIKLHITPPDLTADEIRDGRFTFTKGRALHFCRAHLRMWKGRLILVSAHWRGDPALGIHQGKYRVTA